SAWWDHARNTVWKGNNGCSIGSSFHGGAVLKCLHAWLFSPRTLRIGRRSVDIRRRRFWHTGAVGSSLILAHPLGCGRLLCRPTFRLLRCAFRRFGFCRRRTCNLFRWRRSLTSLFVNRDRRRLRNRTRRRSWRSNYISLRFPRAINPETNRTTGDQEHYYSRS